jgi:hypothetical protein
VQIHQTQREKFHVGTPFDAHEDLLEKLIVHQSAPALAYLPPFFQTTAAAHNVHGHAQIHPTNATRGAQMVPIVRAHVIPQRFHTMLINAPIASHEAVRVFELHIKGIK